MQQTTLIIAVDLGTSATTASHVIVSDSFTAEGKLNRQKGRVSVTNIRDWPGGSHGDATGNVCVPTDLIYSRANGKLLLWGFRAQQYLDDPCPDIPLDEVFVVEHIKLLLLDPINAIADTPASRRYHTLRNTLIATLGKQPEDVFEEFLDEVIAHIIQSANRKYLNGISSFKVELILAFPSGWPDYLHTKVAGTGAKAMAKAIAANKLQNMTFGIENVYTVSETLCGVKEWLLDTIAEATTSIELDQQGTNLNDINEGDCFLPVDIGGGTGCMTPLRLVTKGPLRVDQIGPTQSLAVSGEAVESEFETWLRSQITSDDYPDDIPQLIHQICRQFKEEKKDCGIPTGLGSTTWNIRVPRLQANPDKGFVKGFLKIDRRTIEKCFDPVFDILETSIEQVLREVEGISTIVFLGQFGSSSEYLRQRMAKSHIAELVKLRHSNSGKLNVVRGAISERILSSESFVRKSKTLKSYGTLVTMLYKKGSDGRLLFPNAKKMGAIPFEKAADGLRLTVVEWKISKGTTLENGQTCDLGKEGHLYHTWPYSEKGDIDFQDIIVVSDEVPPAPHSDGKSYTLWTEAHEKDELYLDGKKLQVQQIKFSWYLSMSQKLDAGGNHLGPYALEDLETCMFPEEYRKGKRRAKLRKLDYEFVWNITEMQVKVEVRPLFPNPLGPLTTQLAQEVHFIAHEKSYTGESRSSALKTDIEISQVAVPRSRNIRPRREQVHSTAHPPKPSSPRIMLNLGPRDKPADKVSDSTTIVVAHPSATDSSELGGDCEKESCFPCMLLQTECDRTYQLNATNNTSSCMTCFRYGIDCHKTRPKLDDAQLKTKLLDWQSQVRLGKRKDRGEDNLSEPLLRASPTTVNPVDLTLDRGPVRQNKAPVANMGQFPAEFSAK
ncbi:hypothetical protein VTL71DRAFT_9222 [Oculimacula yallundae]|uniref:Uncharacterized protein n=1 Tax=Oculimacula yallundae TaxID=86028 RepID=A0ABR4BSF7_9HELO